jgi:hypothetical protein
VNVWRAVVVALSVLLSKHGSAYEQKVHRYLSERGYRGPTLLEKSAAEAGVVERLRERLYRGGVEAQDPVLRVRFRARYSDFATFDPWALKRLLGLNPDRRIEGIDQFTIDDNHNGPALAPRALYALASRLPDDDERNRDRFRHDAERHVMKDPYGRPLPEDPATLEMGALTGLSSQAHAHYGLPKIAFSDDPAVLKSEPRRFAVPPSVHTFGAEFIELYTSLAVIAQSLKGGDRLALLFAGNAAHHLEDVANQIHTVQVGLYDFFVDAKIQSIKEELLSVGGLLRARPTFISIGIDLIANHHILAESLYAKHLLTIDDPVREASEHTPLDAQFEETLARLPANCHPGFGLSIAEALIDRSSFEGAEVYRTVRDAADRRLSKVGVHFTEGEDPDGALRPGADLSVFYLLEARGARRSDQALAAWWHHFSRCGQNSDSGQLFVEDLLRRQLAALDEIEARASKMNVRPPTKDAISYWVPAGYLLVIGTALLLFFRARLKRRHRNMR